MKRDSCRKRIVVIAALAFGFAGLAFHPVAFADERRRGGDDHEGGGNSRWVGTWATAVVSSQQRLELPASLRRTPPQVTNSSLNMLLPVTANSPALTCAATAHLQGRRTVSEITPTPAVLLLGGLLTRAGLVVTLARAYDVEVTIETSPDGAPGTWTRIGTVPAGQSEAVFGREERFQVDHPDPAE